MKQAKTLTVAELRRVTDSIATRAHPIRIRAMLMMPHLAGLRVREVVMYRYV
jgi:integrase/recombinase XerD